MEFHAILVFLLLACLVANRPAAAFPVGKERIYTLHNEVRIADHKNGPPIAYRLTGSLHIGCVWGREDLKLLRFSLIAPQLHLPSKDGSFHTHLSHLDTAINRPFFAVWQSGEIGAVYVHGKEDVSLINLKKALVSLTQYQLLDGEYDELDAAGDCAVGYQTQRPGTFEKIWRRCQATEQTEESGPHHRRLEAPVGVRLQTERTATFRVTNDGTLDKVEARETHRYEVQANAKVGAELESVLSLRFDGSISNIEEFVGESPKQALLAVKGLKKQTLRTDVQVPHGRKDEVPFKTAVVNHKPDLTDAAVGTSAAALALLRLTAAARRVDMAGFLKVLKAHTMQELQPQLLDLLAAVQTAEAHEAAKRTVKLPLAEDADRVERYLQGLSVGTRPQRPVLTDLLHTLKVAEFEEPKVRATMVLAVASMAQRLAAGSETKEPLFEQTKDVLVAALAECTDADCRVLYLRGLGNLRSQLVLPTLLEYVHNEDRRVAVAAAKALAQLLTAPSSGDHFTVAHKHLFAEIFHQRRRQYDSSVRALALDILLANGPSDEDLGELLDSLRPAAKDGQFEVRKYLWQQLQMRAERCAQFAARLRQQLRADAALNNYHVLGQRGLTTALSRQFATAPSFNGTLLSVQEMHKGVLKRGVVDVRMEAGGEEFSVFTLGLYAGGLSSFVSSSSAAEDPTDPADEESANAGMELAVQGVPLRPLQFFSTQGELMGHAWSGTASEPTAAYRATTLLHDHFELVRLLNGAAISVRVLGAVSIDLNGQVQFSLWNRNAHCEVNKNSGIALEGKLSLETSFVNLKSVATVTQEPKLSLLADIDFASDPQLCIQLSQPETVLKHDIEKVTKVHGTPILRSNTQSHSYRMSGVTHALNQKNNEMCGAILAEE